MCEQTGEEIDWKRCPPDLEDFPEIVIDSLNIFNSLGNRMYADVGFVGKDYTNLELLYDFYDIKEKRSKEYVFELLLYLEGVTQKESQDQIRAAHDKVKRK
jgi:hypothetical protein